MAIAFCPKCRQDVRPEDRLRLGQRFFCPQLLHRNRGGQPAPFGTRLGYDKHELEGSAEDERRGKLEPA